MSRDGLDRADIDTAMMSDPKIVALSRRIRDPLRTMAAVGLYGAVLLASWKAGERLTLTEALPAWWMDLELAAELGADLIAVRLLDGEERVPKHAFDSWFWPAHGRNRTSERRAIFAGLRSAGMSIEEANAEADRRMGDRHEPLPPVNLKGQPRSNLKVNLRGQPPTNQPSDRPTNRPVRTTTTNGRADGPPVPTEGDCRVCGAHLNDTDVMAKVGPGWIEHTEHPWPA